MSFEPVYGRPKIGRIFLPEARISYPTGGKAVVKHQGILTTTVLKYRGIEKGVFPQYEDEASYEAWKGNVDPSMWEMVPVQAAVSHNQRTTSGSRVQAHRMFALGSSNGAFINVALASILSAGSAVHESLNTATVNSVTAESTKASLARAAGTAASTQATALDGLFTATVTYTWTATGTESVSALGAGLFDTTSTTSFNMYAEATFAAANVQPADQLQLTWTINN